MAAACGGSHVALPSVIGGLEVKAVYCSIRYSKVHSVSFHCAPITGVRRTACVLDAVKSCSKLYNNETWERSLIIQHKFGSSIQTFHTIYKGM